MWGGLTGAGGSGTGGFAEACGSVEREPERLWVFRAFIRWILLTNAYSPTLFPVLGSSIPAAPFAPTPSSLAPTSLRSVPALAATGTIWARYATVITPKNYSLMLVNVFVAGTGFFQLWRIWE